MCLGATGKISVLREPDDEDDRTLADVVTGLPSLGLQGSGGNAVGPSDVAFERGNRLLATIGLAGDPDIRTTPVPGGIGRSALASQLGTVIRGIAVDGDVASISTQTLVPGQGEVLEVELD